ncbi:MAG: hypothetical protein ACYDAG_04535, partial [Chloroflexota bacterium]
VSESRIRVTDSSEAQAATFAYIAASCMSQFKAPFYVAPSVRAGVRCPRNLAEFLDTVGTVREVTSRACSSRFRDVVASNDWRVAFVFWEATKWLAQTMRVN